MAHTPGPWINVGHWGGFKSEIDGGGRPIATVWTKQSGLPKNPIIPWPEGESNAILITLAPEMLRLLRTLEYITDYEGTTWCPWCSEYKKFKQPIKHEPNCPWKAIMARVEDL